MFCCEYYEVLNTFTPNQVYLRSNRDRLPVPPQMQLSEKPKTFCCFLLQFWNLPTLNLQHFHKKISLEHISLVYRTSLVAASAFF